jgi:tetratricopeptide (TPR) repeat protein
VTTSSLDALRKYSQALQVQSQGDNPGAIALLEDAVAQDSNFAMAWRKLGTMLTNAGQRPARAEAALTRAFALRDRLTFRERKLTENSYYSDARGFPDSAVAALQSLLAEYPNDSWAWNNLGVMHETNGNDADAERAYKPVGGAQNGEHPRLGQPSYAAHRRRSLRLRRGDLGNCTGDSRRPRDGHERRPAGAGPPGLRLRRDPASNSGSPASG